MTFEGVVGASWFTNNVKRKVSNGRAKSFVFSNVPQTEC